MQKRTVWQIASGEASRTYTDIFLQFGVALIGSGDPGKWIPEREDSDFGGHFVRRFANDVSINDIFLLRSGISSIHAIGIVASDYMYLNQFDDVNGWDLQHARRVRWFRLPEKYDFNNKVFGSIPSRFAEVGNKEVIDYAEKFINSSPTEWQSAPLQSLPEEEPMLKDIPPYLQDIHSKAKDLISLFWDRDNFGDHPSEDEIIAHFVVPLLEKLGWQPELIAVKWRRIDIAVFKQLPRTPENCQYIIEAKRYGEGIEGAALEQAINYVKSLGVLRDVIVTDGIRYRIYGCDKAYALVAYANLDRLKASALNLFERLKKR